ncbi:MAG: hypothetical protein Q9217_002682 [Psora testacea]
MPGSKKRITPRPKVTKAAGVSSEAKLENSGREVVNQNALRHEAQTLAAGKGQRKHDENVAFWRDLGYYDLNRKYNNSKVVRDHKTNRLKKPKDYGNIKEKYNLYVNPSTKRILLLQYPNREPQEIYCDATGQKPLEVRIKPKCGIVEVDVPMSTETNFDKEKGVDFGSALRKSQSLQNGGSYGLPGGLGIGPNKAIRIDENAIPDGPPRERLLENFDDSNNKGHVMNKITLGGRIVPFKDGDPMYMIATFSDTRCTWTRLDAIVQLRPQFGHLDAVNEQEKSSARPERNTESRLREERAEDVNMVIKDTADNENIDMYGGMNETAKLLRAMRDEPWQHLKWVDQEDNYSYETYNRTLVYQNSEDAAQLSTEMTDEQYLDAISCPRIDPINQGKKVMRSLDDDEDSLDTEKSTSDMEDIDEDPADASADDSDASEGGRAYETLPKGVMKPNGIMERDVERTCRIICMEGKHRRDKLEHLLRNSKAHKPRFNFLDPKNKFHTYFRWRLRCNERGNGIGPEFDHNGAQSEPQNTTAG